MNILNRVAFIAGMTACLGAQAELKNIQEAIEASDLSISALESGKGYVNARSCSTCKYMMLKLTPDTRISVNGKLTAARNNISRHWSGGVVIYDIETKQVVRLDL